MNVKQNQKLKGYKSLQNALMMLAAFAVMFFLAVLLPGGRTFSSRALVFAGMLIMLFGATIYYTIFSDANAFDSYRKFGVICTTMVLNFLLMILFGSGYIELPFLMPYAMGTLVVGTLVGRRVGVFTNLTTILAYGSSLLVFGDALANSTDLLNLFYPVFCGLLIASLASYSVDKYPKRLTYIVAGGFLGLISAAVGLFCYLMTIEHVEFIFNEFFVLIIQAMLSGPLAVMFMFLAVPLFERMFNIVTNFRLAEISSSNQPLLVKLYEEAPGTFAHSLIIGNYMEACAQALGENPFLARACAFYHDIGKLHAPQYFIENQQSGVNPHDGLTPEASVVSIKRHVSYGLMLAKKYRLPVEVQASIAEHHGTMPIKFFYLKAKKYIDGDLPYDDYRHDGPLPHGKLNAVLMIVDACEAALRASSNREKAALIVDSVIAERTDFHQFDECDLTMRDLETIRYTILTTYLGNKHKRIEYPTVKILENPEKE